MSFLTLLSRAEVSRVKDLGDSVPETGVDLPVADLFENASLAAAAEEYAWVNARQAWGFGTVDFATGKIHIDAYMQ
jgi:hypothetical protein